MANRAAEIVSKFHLYRVFDFILASTFPLPMLPAVDAGKAGVEVTLLPNESVDEGGFAWFHEWTDQAGETVLAGARREDEYLLRFPGLADFLIGTGLTDITVYPTSGVHTTTLSHLLVDQVLPRILNQQGRLVIHASAVLLSGGRVAAFLGDSGEGKSTLAASFLSSGCRLVADDCIVLSLHDGIATVLPPYCSLRLWDDSVQKLFPDDSAFQAVAHYSDKRQVKLAGADSRAGPVTLSALFILGELPSSGPGIQVRIAPAGGTETLMALIRSMFTLDHDDPGVITQNFRTASEFLAWQLPVYRLNYERRYNLLPGVRRAIAEAVEGIGQNV